MNTSKVLADRLITGLAQLTTRDSVAPPADAVNNIADLSERLYQQMADLPADTRQLIHTADSGFASSGAWVDDAIDAQTQQLKKLARAANMLATWHSPNGVDAERVFVIRGNIRGWAHRWRKEDKGPAQIDSDPGFVAFASECLTTAGVAGDHAMIVEKALKSDWRTNV
jgi:hypothetical protein